ncbi:endonuclease/exonuclease/phosphatase family protein [Sphingobium sp.]|uniref:endonuclease/exonuclease/phosphatase family protein n=1 Tax=Sphingobium sp. TaxID=1912891 RepID=UPI002605CCE6|nr:endonuclease/exonuclease/phosphatase family protein [Sphingobium sp.]
MSKSVRALLFASLTVLLAASSPSASSSQDGFAPAMAALADDLPLSVMTYNVMGLPWPVAFGRDEALARIADRLAGLRAQGRQPHILLLQEAFIVDPAAFARRAGYAYVAAGPGVEDLGDAAPTPADRAYLRAARWDRGEGMGKQLGSGLLILSDWPIAAVDRMAYPAFACAGFDCLANKGILIAHLRVPGMARPVAVVNTHLNARKAAGVPIARSQTAFGRQAGLLVDFVRAHAPADRAIVIGGDFNIGRDPRRIDAFFGRWARVRMGFVSAAMGGGPRALQETALADPAQRRDLAEAVGRGKDWLFARGESGAPLPVVQARTPFGGAPADRLSDHVGYALSYGPPSRPLQLAQADMPAGGR